MLRAEDKRALCSGFLLLWKKASPSCVKHAEKCVKPQNAVALALPK